jgi:hypothetical protein
MIAPLGLGDAIRILSMPPYKAFALWHDGLRVGVVLDARDIVLRAYE